MAGQMKDLLGEVRQSLEKVDDRYIKLLERVAALEQDRVWNGEERRKVDGRLETGDHTFAAHKARLEAAEAAAKRATSSASAALNALAGLRGELAELKKKPETTIRRKWRDYFIEHGVKVAVGVAVYLVMTLVYHILIFGPQIAKALKAAHGGSE